MSNECVFHNCDRNICGWFIHNGNRIWPVCEPGRVKVNACQQEAKRQEEAGSEAQQRQEGAKERLYYCRAPKALLRCVAYPGQGICEAIGRCLDEHKFADQRTGPDRRVKILMYKYKLECVGSSGRRSSRWRRKGD